MAFKIGDRVTIYRKVTKRNQHTFNNIWVHQMDSYIKNTSTIKSITNIGIILEGIAYAWPPSALKYAKQ